VVWSHNTIPYNTTSIKMGYNSTEQSGITTHTYTKQKKKARLSTINMELFHLYKVQTMNYATPYGLTMHAGIAEPDF
jgi:hypothetical protein